MPTHPVEKRMKPVLNDFELRKRARSRVRLQGCNVTTVKRAIPGRRTASGPASCKGHGAVATAAGKAFLANLPLTPVKTMGFLSFSPPGDLRYCLTAGARCRLMSVKSVSALTIFFD